jgi:hypothetical protein
MRKLFLIILMFAGTAAKAQHDPSDQIFSFNWEIIGGVEFKMVKDNQSYAMFTPEIKKHANRTFELEGYIVPIKDGMKQTKFLLSTLPINQCFFCGQNGVPMMVMVVLNEPVKFTYQPIKVRGTLKLSEAKVMDAPPITLVNGIAL